LLSVQAGDHVAASFDDDDGFAATTAWFVDQGLRRRARVLVLAEARNVEPVRERLRAVCADAVAAQRSGRLQLLDPHQVQLGTGRFDPAYLRESYAAAARQAVDEGHTGLWVSVDMTWASPPVVPTDALVRFEAEANTLFASGQLTAICQYGTRDFSGETIRRALSAHPHNAHGSTFRHHMTPDGTFLVVWGEVDLSNRDAWTVIVNATATWGPVIDITAMTFLDVRAMTTLGWAAMTREHVTVVATPEQARRLRLVCPAELDRVTVEIREPALRTIN